MDLNMKRVERIVRFALKEDIWTGDVTSEAVLDPEFQVDAVIIAKDAGVVCGVTVAERVFSVVDDDVRFRPLVKDSDRVEAGREIAFIAGRARSIMRSERVALNFLSHLSGIATKTREMVDGVTATGAMIYDTRKTMPLHRYMQKYAVTAGGGVNHRWGLWDMVLIKDNHIRSYGMQSASVSSENIIKNMVRQAKGYVQKNIKVEIEVESLEECGYALEAGADIIMLDNMPPEAVKEAVAMRGRMGLSGKVLLEVSGGITPDNVPEYAGTGVDIISSGALTNSVDPIDFSLEVVIK